MKLFKSIMTLATAALFAACQTDIDTPQIGNSADFVAPVLGACGDVIVNADNADSENVIFSWTAADFGLPVQVLYQIYLVRGDVEALAGATNSTSIAIPKGDLNGVVINGLGVSANETVEVTAYVSATVANTTKYEAIKSEQSAPFSVSTYAAPLKWLYLVGEFNNWAIETAPIFWETAAGTNIYECMVDFTPTNEAPTKAGHSFFKITAQQAWVNDDTYGSTGDNKLSTPSSWVVEENADGNLSLPLADGVINQISVNLAAMSISKKALGNSLGLTGTFNGWGDTANGGTPDAVFTYDALTSTWKTEPVSLPANAEIKLRIDGTWEGTLNWGDAGKTSTAVAGGMELAEGGGNIVVAEGGTYVVVLHANRTPYVLELQKQ